MYIRALTYEAATVDMQDYALGSLRFAAEFHIRADLLQEVWSVLHDHFYWEWTHHSYRYAFVLVSAYLQKLLGVATYVTDLGRLMDYLIINGEVHLAHPFADSIHGDYWKMSRNIEYFHPPH